VELLVADPPRHQQEGVVLAGGLPGAQRLGVAPEVLPVGDHDAPGGRDDLADPADRRVDLHVRQLGLEDEQGDLAAGVQDPHRPVLGVRGGGGEQDVVLAGVAGELLLQHVEVGAGDEDDRGVAHRSSMALRGERGRPSRAF
jgi:hypothetical protein